MSDHTTYSVRDTSFFSWLPSSSSWYQRNQPDSVFNQSRVLLNGGFKCDAFVYSVVKIKGEGQKWEQNISCRLKCCSCCLCCSCSSCTSCFLPLLFMLFSCLCIFQGLFILLFFKDLAANSFSLNRNDWKFFVWWRRWCYFRKFCCPLCILLNKDVKNAEGFRRMQKKEVSVFLSAEDTCITREMHGGQEE